MSVVRNMMEMVKVFLVSIWIGLLSLFLGPGVPFVISLPFREYFDDPTMIFIENVIYAIFIYGAILMLKERFHAGFDIASYRSKANIDKVYDEFNEKYGSELEKGIYEESFEVAQIKRKMNKWMLAKLICVIVIGIVLIAIFSIGYYMSDIGAIVSNVAFYGSVATLIFIKIKKGFEIKISENSGDYSKLSIALMNLMYARHIWQITEVGAEYCPEKNYNITRNIKKNKVHIESKKPGYIKSNLGTMSIRFKRERWIFAPALIIVVRGFKVKVYDYSQLEVSGGERRCIDGYKLPKDAEALKVLSQYINRDDSRDMRYKKNDERILYRVGVIVLKLGEDRVVELQVSNIHSANNFLEVVGDYEYIDFDMGERDGGKVKAFPPAIISRILGV